MIAVRDFLSLELSFCNTLYVQDHTIWNEIMQLSTAYVEQLPTPTSHMKWLTPSTPLASPRGYPDFNYST